MKTYGLIGFPLTHSFSKKYFSDKFINENVHDCEYTIYPLATISELKNLIQTTPTLCGLNVTLPYKESVIPLLDEIDETAKAIGSVNCIKIESQILKGYNTDIFGFRQSIKPFLEAHHEKALILGTGGGAKAVAYVLKQIGVDYYFVSRDKSEYKNSNCFTYDELNEYIINSFTLIVNTTPLGMFPEINGMPQLPYKYITSKHLLYDLVYNPTETEFIKQGKKNRATCLNGLSMLHLQAEESWRIWNYKLDF